MKRGSATKGGSGLSNISVSPSWTLDGAQITVFTTGFFTVFRLMNFTGSPRGWNTTVGTLRYWCSRLKHDGLKHKPTGQAGEVRIARVVAPGTLVEADMSVVLELADVRIALRRGFDAETLRRVLDVLGSRSA